jgi:hypothetical protein
MIYDYRTIGSNRSSDDQPSRPAARIMIVVSDNGCPLVPQPRIAGQLGPDSMGRTPTPHRQTFDPAILLLMHVGCGQRSLAALRLFMRGFPLGL